MFPPPRSRGSFRSPRISRASSRTGCASRCCPAACWRCCSKSRRCGRASASRPGMAHLGGSSIMLGEDAGFGKRESVADFARVLSEMVDVIVVRSKRHETVVAVRPACRLLGDQRPDGPGASVPGAGRPVHAARALRRAGGPTAGVGRRRQQRGPQPGRRLRPLGRAAGRVHAAGLRAR